MTAPSVTTLVKNLKPRFLEGLTASELRAVVAAADYRRYLANSVVLNQEHPAGQVFLLITGRARSSFITQGGQRMLLLWLPPGEVFGLATLLSRASEYLVSTETVKDSTALVWERDTIRDLAGRYPRLWENALSIATDYLNGYLAVHVSQTYHSARQRLAKVLVNLASGIGHRVEAGVEVTIQNEELASAANVTTFTASRLLNEWQRDGMLIKSRGKILLPSPERLLLHEV